MGILCALFLRFFASGINDGVYGRIDLTTP